MDRVSVPAPSRLAFGERLERTASIEQKALFPLPHATITMITSRRYTVWLGGLRMSNASLLARRFQGHE